LFRKPSPREGLIHFMEAMYMNGLVGFRLAEKREKLQPQSKTNMNAQLKRFAEFCSAFVTIVEYTETKKPKQLEYWLLKNKASDGTNLRLDTYLGMKMVYQDEQLFTARKEDYRLLGKIALKAVQGKTSKNDLQLALELLNRLDREASEVLDAEMHAIKSEGVPHL
jgi:hypothetical protein